MIYFLLFAAAAVAPTNPAFVQKPCADPKLAKVARCGSVRVPENRAAPGGRTIDLNVIIVNAAAPKSGEAPLFDIDGGPGLAATKNADYYAFDGAALRAHRDVVVVDQRGTGGSNPLQCPELAAPEAAFRPMLPVNAVERCRRQLEARADVRLYGTREAVADLDDVRRALGHRTINLFGMSYGSTVALRYIATHPDRVRAAILVGVAPPDARPPRGHAPAAQRALDLLFAQCRTDRPCAGAFDPDADLRTALERLPSIAGAPPRDVFLEKIRSLMYFPAAARRVPLILHHAAAGDLEPFLALTKPQGPSPYADGMFLTVTCAEGIALTDVPAARRDAARTLFGDYRLRRQADACAHWPRATPAKDHLTPIASDVPILMVSGELDPVTDPAWAEALAARLPRSKHVVIPGSGHIYDGMDGAESCVDAMMATFLDSASVDTLDTRCVRSMRAPPFALPDGR